MAPQIRTFFIVLVTITGVIYFLYAIYTAILEGPTYRFGSWSKGFSTLSYSSSPLIQKKEEQYSSMNTFTSSISNMINNDNRESISNAAINKNSGSNSISNNLGVDQSVSASSPVASVEVVTVAGISKQNGKTEEKITEKRKDEERKSVIQRIPPKSDNVTVDSVVEGVITRTLYVSGFTLPNVELCPDFGQRLQLVIIITSHPDHAAARTAIRQTWGHYQLRKDIAIAFIIGQSSDLKQSVIQKENDLYGDIIVANFIDSYNNLTLKTVSILEWVDNYCGQAKFVLKTDDDMFVNIPKLLMFIESHLGDKRKIFGKLAKKWKPIRKKTSKYYISVKQYKMSVFPDFTTGPAYLMTSDVIHDLYVTALEKTYLKLEDVYTTGIVAEEKNIRRVHVNEFINRRITLSPCNVQKGISIHMIKPFEQYDLWKKLLDGRSKC